MHDRVADRIHTPVSPPGEGVRRREAAECIAAACLLVATCAARGQPARPEAVPGDLRRARRDFDAMVFAASLLDLDARASFVNIAINRSVTFALDPPSVPGGDVWSTPFETLARRAGDCEDFAIAKFYLLIASGAPPRVCACSTRSTAGPTARPCRSRTW